MVRQARSTSTERNPDLCPLDRKKGESNFDWGMRAVKEMKSGGRKASTYIALLGGTDTVSFRTRVAQSVLRPDMLPSYWSEAILIELASDSLKDAKALYVPLAQPDSPAFPPMDNGVVTCPLESFADAQRYPNIALIALPVPQERILARVETFKRSRGTIDALEHVVRWLAYTWGVARTTNPLNDNYGVPSACMLEVVCAAENYDLTPGLESRASCPEAIWAAAAHWHEYYARVSEGKGKDASRKPIGRYTTRHQYAIASAESS
jgi:hypothetical protein